MPLDRPIGKMDKKTLQELLLEPDEREETEQDRLIDEKIKRMEALEKKIKKVNKLKDKLRGLVANEL